MTDLSSLEQRDAFVRRHIGPDASEQQTMLAAVGVGSVEELLAKAVPEAIRHDELRLGEPVREHEVLAELRELAGRNTVLRSCIGMGYTGTITPPVIRRNVLENPAWYTAYTPYQPEISQGRLEALLNFQTMVSDLTGMELANASLLDEGTAAAEAMAMCHRISSARGDVYLVDADCHPQTIAVVETRARPLGIEVRTFRPGVDDLDAEAYGVLLQYPGSSGTVRDHRDLIAACNDAGVLVTVAADILSLALLTPPGEMGADVVVGSTQRFGVPMMFGGPHAAYMATREAHKRALPGRLVGVSVDRQGRQAYRLALQTREQHIRRERATSNICTSQVLLAVMAGMYATYHGPEGLRTIARRTHALTAMLAAALRDAGVEVVTEAFFDTLTIRVPGGAAATLEAAVLAGYNLRPVDADHVGVTFDETTTRGDVEAIAGVFGVEVDVDALAVDVPSAIPTALRRTSDYLTHPVFNRHHSETEMLRYLRALADKDVALDRSMIPLGSCTMKLNATAEMEPVTWPAFADLHPFAPAGPGRRAPRAHPRARGSARRDHRLRPGLAAAERGVAGRVRRSPRDPLLPRGQRGHPARHLPDPVVRARDQRRIGRHGRDAGEGGRLRR